MSSSADPGLGEGLRHRVDRPDAHDRRIDAGGREADEPPERAQSQGGGAVAGHHDQGGRAVAHLGRVAGGDAAAGCEHGLQPGHLGGIGVVADALVGVERDLADARAAVVIDVGQPRGDRHHLVEEASLALRGRCALVRAQAPRVLGVAADVEALGHVLGGQAHAEVDLRPVVGHGRVGREAVADHRHEAHRLHAAGDDDVVHAGLHRLRRQRQRLEARRRRSG